MEAVQKLVHMVQVRRGDFHKAHKKATDNSTKEMGIDVTRSNTKLMLHSVVQQIANRGDTGTVENKSASTFAATLRWYQMTTDSTR